MALCDCVRDVWKRKARGSVMAARPGGALSPAQWAQWAQRGAEGPGQLGSGGGA